MAFVGLKGFLSKVGRSVKRLSNPRPGWELVLRKHEQRQREHYKQVMQTPFAPATLKMPSEGRKWQLPTPGTFANASGFLRGETIHRHKISITGLKVGPLAQGVTKHPYSSTPFDKIVAKQEQIQQRKGAGSLMYKRTRETNKEDLSIMMGYWFEGWGKR